MSHWKYNATRCAMPSCEVTRRKGWTTCGRYDHHNHGRSLYGLEPKAPQLVSFDRDEAHRLADETGKPVLFAWSPHELASASMVISPREVIL